MKTFLVIILENTFRKTGFDLHCCLISTKKLVAVRNCFKKLSMNPEFHGLGNLITQTIILKDSICATSALRMTKTYITYNA